MKTYNEVSIKDKGRKEMQEKMTTGNDVITVWGCDDVYNFMADYFVTNGNNEFWFGNVLMIPGDYYLNIRIHTDNTDISVASIVLNYDDFAMRYRSRDNDIKLLSRTGEKITDKVYIHFI